MYLHTLATMRMRTFQDWRLKSLHKKIGLSDHTQNVLAPAIAVSMGAEVIEKHFTTSNELEGRDNKFALDPEKFQSYV